MNIDQKHRDRWVAYATMYSQRFGISVFPIGESKKPAIEWGKYQSRLPTLGEIISWAGDGLAISLGAATGEISNLVVVDCDTREDAEWFARNRSTSPVIVQTARGYHFYFRHPGQRVMNGQRIKDETGRPRYDVRGDGGYVKVPPSFHANGEYTWRKPLIEQANLPVFDMAWRPETRAATHDSDKRIHDGAAYISKIKAVAGNGGHNDTWRAACSLREAGLSESEALLVLLEWNRTNADPPWSERELLHKIRGVFDGDVQS